MLPNSEAVCWAPEKLLTLECFESSKMFLPHVLEAGPGGVARKISNEAARCELSGGVGALEVQGTATSKHFTA